MEKIDVKGTVLDLAGDARKNVSKVQAMLSAAIYLMSNEVVHTTNSDRVNYVDWLIDMRDRLEEASDNMMDMNYFIQDNA